MSKPDKFADKNHLKKRIHWVVSVFVITLIISGLITFLSDAIMDYSSTAVAFVILFLIVLIGISFDVIGMAVASADEKPFHSMAARKVPGAQEAISLLRNAERVSSICNDVVGDICGVVSGAASATIAARILAQFSFTAPKLISLFMSAMVAGLTVSGKAIGKYIAVESCVPIVHYVGRLMSLFKSKSSVHRKKR